MFKNNLILFYNMKLIFKKAGYWFFIGFCITVPFELFNNYKKNDDIHQRYNLNDKELNKKISKNN